jgi:hypothetical protein
LAGPWRELLGKELGVGGGKRLGHMAEVIDQAHRGIDRVRRTPHLAYSFLR